MFPKFLFIYLFILTIVIIKLAFKITFFYFMLSLLGVNG